MLDRLILVKRPAADLDGLHGDVPRARDNTDQVYALIFRYFGPSLSFNLRVHGALTGTIEDPWDQFEVGASPRPPGPWDACDRDT